MMAQPTPDQRVGVPGVKWGAGHYVSVCLLIELLANSSVAALVTLNTVLMHGGFK